MPVTAAENASSVPNCNVLPRLAAAGFMEPRRVGARQGVSSSSSMMSSILWPSALWLVERLVLRREV